MSDTTPELGSIITNPFVRKVIYGAYGIVSLGATALQVYDAATKTTDPSWLVGGLAVIVFLGIPVGGLAVANAPAAK